MSRGQEEEEKRVDGKRLVLRKSLWSEAWGWLGLEIAVGTSWEWGRTEGLAKTDSRVCPSEQLIFQDVECRPRSPGLPLGTSERQRKTSQSGELWRI